MLLPNKQRKSTSLKRHKQAETLNYPHPTDTLRERIRAFITHYLLRLNAQKNNNKNPAIITHTPSQPHSKRRENSGEIIGAFVSRSDGAISLRTLFRVRRISTIIFHICVRKQFFLHSSPSPGTD